MRGFFLTRKSYLYLEPKHPMWKDNGGLPDGIHLGHVSGKLFGMYNQWCWRIYVRIPENYALWHAVCQHIKSGATALRFNDVRSCETSLREALRLLQKYGL